MNSTKKINKENVTFNDEIWSVIVSKVAVFIGCSKDKELDIYKCKLLKLISSLPFIAKCNQPMRIAVCNTVVTVMASDPIMKNIFLHNDYDSKNLSNRLERISHFDGGDEAILRRGMNLIKIIMITDHLYDLPQDIINGKYNPIASGVWSLSCMKVLEKEIKMIDCPEMDDIITLHEAKNNYWYI